MSDVGAVDSPQDDQRSVKISEDPNSQAALEDLFKVLSQDKPKLGKPMSDRKLPESFFNAKAPRLLLGPSISVRPNAASSAHHLKSFSMPANLEPGHSRPLSLESTLQELPPGWEEARTPDGLTYYIDHSTRTTTWENPRKMMHHHGHQLHMQPNRLPHQHMPPYPHQASMQQSHQQHHPQMPQHQSLDAMALPDGWNKAYTPEGEVYYVNHKARTTSWLHPSATPHHQHSHSYAGIPRAMGGAAAPFYSHHHGTGLHQQEMQRRQQQHFDMHQRQDQQPQQQHLLQQNQIMVGGAGDVNRVPATLYNDPYLSSSGHVRQASHDSGLGTTVMPYQAELGAEYEEGMDTGNAAADKSNYGQGVRSGSGRSNTLEYLDGMPPSDIDGGGLQEHHTAMASDQPMQEQMEGGDLLSNLAWV